MLNNILEILCNVFSQVNFQYKILFRYNIEHLVEMIKNIKDIIVYIRATIKILVQRFNHHIKYSVVQDLMF